MCQNRVVSREKEFSALPCWIVENCDRDGRIKAEQWQREAGVDGNSISHLESTGHGERDTQTALSSLKTHRACGLGANLPGRHI